jgi:hypothetical protein
LKASEEQNVCRCLWNVNKAELVNLLFGLLLVQLVNKDTGKMKLNLTLYLLQHQDMNICGVVDVQLHALLTPAQEGVE